MRSANLKKEKKNEKKNRTAIQMEDEKRFPGGAMYQRKPKKQHLSGENMVC